MSGPVFERLDEKLGRELACLGEASPKGTSSGVPIHAAFPAQGPGHRRTVGRPLFPRCLPVG